MRCLSCDKNLSDKEASRKYLNHEEISNPEDKYIGLCNGCLSDSELHTYQEDFKQSDELPNDDIEPLYEGDCI